MNVIEKIIRRKLQHYNPKKYWKLRERVVNPEEKYPKILKAIWLFKIKRSDAFNNASTGAHLNYGAKFESMPKLPHGLYGIIISHNAVIGKNCTIFHQVTIGEGNNGAPVIGDNCVIGAGAKITGGIKIGNNVKIGTNCVVAWDIPDNTTVVMQKPRMLIKDEVKA